MAKKKNEVVVRMEDPKAKAKPDLSYGASTLSVQVDEDTRGYPLKLTVTTVVDLPEATEKKRLNQDLLAAARITGQAGGRFPDGRVLAAEQEGLGLEDLRDRDVGQAHPHQGEGQPGPRPRAGGS